MIISRFEITNFKEGFIMKLKKTVALALVTAMTATMAAGCGGSSSDKGAAQGRSRS